jgi:aspartyl-tRNA(Asn)/glutamyl-tRNA(Gln) amidotransferase subunit A
MRRWRRKAEGGAPATSMQPMDLDLLSLGAAYRRGRTSATKVTRALLERSEPGPILRLVTADRALAQAARADTLFARGIDLGPLQGIPIALKDLIDTQGDVTAAGSAVLADGPAAAEDATLVRRLDAAGAVFLGKTTMTELAFSGLGLNQHAPIPANALDPTRIPGGSSSGSAIAVASGLVSIALGSDTGGSVRIPAAFNGLVGLKPTVGSLPMDGVVPAVPTHDTVGPIATTVRDAWHAWRALLGVEPAWFVPTAVAGLELLAPTNVLLDDLEDEVRSGFERAVATLEALGARVVRRDVPTLEAIDTTFGRVHSINSIEYGAAHGALAERAAGRMDPRVVRRLRASAACPAEAYLDLLEERARLEGAFWQEVGPAAAIVSPTAPILPPPLEPLLRSDEAFDRANRMAVRNTRVANYLGAPSVTVPAAGTAHGLAVGFMVTARDGAEHLALSIAAAVERAPG